MAEIVYSRITYSSAEPTNPANYDWWIKNIDATYQIYFYVSASWIPLTGGGVYITENNPDDHFINTVISDIEPTAEIKFGWLWVNDVTQELKLYLGEYIILLGW
jgi:hypothetical protein